MKQFLLLSLLLFSFTALSKGTYSCEVTIFSLDKPKVLAGIIVTCKEEKGKTIIDTTDANGNVRFVGLSKKWLDFHVLDPNNIYSERGAYLKNEERSNTSKSIYLAYGIEKEEELIRSKSYVSNDKDSINLFNQIRKEFTACGKENFKEAEYKGGHGELMKFIHMNLIFPQVAIDKKIQGKVYMELVIESDGSVSNIHIARGIHPDIDYQAVRVAAYFPDFIPASCNGKAIRAVYYIPFTFALD